MREPRTRCQQATVDALEQRVESVEVRAMDGGRVLLVGRDAGVERVHLVVTADGDRRRATAEELRHYGPKVRLRSLFASPTACCPTCGRPIEASS